jgi:hypothetical protein
MRSGRKNHYTRPGEARAVCGRPLGEQIHLVLKTEDVTCLSCINALTEPWHGTPGGYRNHDCRCAPCTRANTGHVARWRAVHRGLEPPYHGEYGYNMFGCRCPACRKGHRQYRAGRRATA